MIAHHVFGSRFIDYNVTFEARSFRKGTLAHLFKAEVEAIHEDTKENFNATAFNETQHDMFELFYDADEDLQAEIDENEIVARDNRIAICAIGFAVGFFTLLVLYVQLKEELNCCLCCKNELPQ